MNLLHADNGPEMLNGNLRTVSKTWNVLVRTFYNTSFFFSQQKKQAGALRRQEQPCTVYTYPQ